MDGNYFSNLSFPCPREVPNKISATVAQRLQRRSCLKCSKLFQYTCIVKQTWPCHKKVKCQCMTIILANLADLPSLMIYAKFQLQGILDSGEDFLKDLPYMGMATILVKDRNHFSNLSFPCPRELQIKFEQHWPRGSREVNWNSQHFFPIQIHREANLTSP